MDIVRRLLAFALNALGVLWLAYALVGRGVGVVDHVWGWGLVLSGLIVRRAPTHEIRQAETKARRDMPPA